MMRHNGETRIWSGPTARMGRFLFGCSISSLILNILIFSSIGGDQESMQTFRRDHIHQAKSLMFVLDVNETVPHTFAQNPSSRSRRQSLSCETWGGPSDDVAAEMVYWSDIPSDAEYTSPFFNEDTQEKFLFFDPDMAGFNNKRVSFENFVLMAHAMGRTLVLPPRGFWWGFQHVNGTHVNVQDSKRWSFEDFYDLDNIRQAGFKIKHMEDFLIQHAMSGQLRDKGGKVSFPPYNRTNWDDGWLKNMRNWLKTVTAQITWRPEDCLAAFPSQPNHIETMEAAMQQLKKNPPKNIETLLDNPNPVDAPLLDRLSEVLVKRKSLCYYDQQLQDERYLYYKIQFDTTTYETQYVTNIRLLTWFYQFFIFEDWKQDLWAKRFIRDTVRYKDELQCIAARVVAAMRAKARSKHDGNDQFDTFHIRRLGEFEDQFGNLTDSLDIYNVAVPDIPEGSTVYIATDDMNRSVFQPLIDHYDVYFLGDFQKLLGNLNPNYYSIIDQLVASRGRVFFGAFCSTFTGYINRIRGYHSQKDKAEGWQKGVLDSYFYNYQAWNKRNDMRIYRPPVKQWFFREFPLAWRDIDHDLESYNSASSEDK